MKQNTGDVEVAPSYWNNDKRSMPLLPWLPASRKKRFPVAKRSPKVNSDLIVPQPEANKKVSQDLQGIFGATESDKNGVEEVKTKKKRSSGDAKALSENNTEKGEKSEKSRSVHMLAHMAQKKRKRDASDPDDEEEVEPENSGSYAFFSIQNHLNELFNALTL